MDQAQGCPAKGAADGGFACVSGRDEEASASVDTNAAAGEHQPTDGRAARGCCDGGRACLGLDKHMDVKKLAGYIRDIAALLPDAVGKIGEKEIDRGGVGGVRRVDAGGKGRCEGGAGFDGGEFAIAAANAESAAPLQRGEGGEGGEDESGDFEA